MSTDEVLEYMLFACVCCNGTNIVASIVDVISHDKELSRAICNDGVYRSLTSVAKKIGSERGIITDCYTSSVHPRYQTTNVRPLQCKCKGGMYHDFSF